MIQVNRKDLEIVAQYIDNNNPKFELDYLLIDADNMVATNTRAIGVIKHNGTLDKGVETILIHKSVVVLALKQTKAKRFNLDENKIVCLDDKDDEIITICINRENYHRNFPEYGRIIPKEIEKIIPFTSKTQIEGILATELIEVDNMHIPKTKEDFIGYVGINDKNLPIAIMNEKKEVLIVVMPIIDSFDIFRQ